MRRKKADRHHLNVQQYGEGMMFHRVKEANEQKQSEYTSSMKKRKGEVCEAQKQKLELDVTCSSRETLKTGPHWPLHSNVCHCDSATHFFISPLSFFQRIIFCPSYCVLYTAFETVIITASVSSLKNWTVYFFVFFTIPIFLLYISVLNFDSINFNEDTYQIGGNWLSNCKRKKKS